MIDATTPIERRGDLWLKRDDLFDAFGAPGGKARTCLAILETARESGATTAVTASSRHSPQAIIVARIAAGLGMASRIHTPAGAITDEIRLAIEAGAEHIVHRPGYNTVIVARARADAETLLAQDAVEVPFGMECQEAVNQTAKQARSTAIPDGVERVVVPVGSGMSLAGLIAGLPNDLPILGVAVGADPSTRLDHYAPGWRDRVELASASVAYEVNVDASIEDVLLDPVYEAKCAGHLRPGDLLWVVGIRANLVDTQGIPA